MSEESLHLDDSARQVARVYAQALWTSANQAGKSNELLEEYESLVNDVLGKVKDLELFFSSLAGSSEQRIKFLEAVFKPQASPMMFQFLLTLEHHGRLSLVRPVLTWLKEFRDRAAGRKTVKVRSAIPLSPARQSQLSQVIADRFKITPNLDLSVDPSVLGGLWIKIDDTVYDRTVLRDLRRLQDNIQTRSSHEIQSGRDSLDRSA